MRILFQFGISEKSPLPGMHGALPACAHGAGILPPPITQLPLCQSKPLFIPGSSVAMLNVSYLSPKFKVSRELSFHSSCAYRPHDGHLAMYFWLRIVYCAGSPSNAEATELPVVAGFAGSAVCALLNGMLCCVVSASRFCRTSMPPNFRL